MDIKLESKKEDKRAKQRVQKAQQKKDDSKFEPTWDQVWTEGYTRPTGTTKKAIFQMKNTATDESRLYEVKQAVEEGLIGTGVESLLKFNKAQALRLYEELKVIKREDVIEDMKENCPGNYYTITTPTQLLDAVNDIPKEFVIAVDTETSGVEWKDITVGMSITLPTADYHVYIPYGHQTKEGELRKDQLDREFVMNTVKPALEGSKLVLFNAKFDAHMLEKDNIDIQNSIYFDPMISAKLLNENEPSYALKNLANKYGKYFDYNDTSLKFNELFSNNPIDFIRADMDIASIYACKDTHLTYLLYEWHMEQFTRLPELEKLYFDIENPITKVSLEMERGGLLMDTEFAKDYGEELSTRITELETIMENNWGDINTNSPQQLKEKLFVELGYEDISGKGSTNAQVLKKLAKDHEDVNALLEYRDLNKLYTTYVDKLPGLIRGDIEEYGIKGDGRLHGSFHQTGTVTGRFSSNNPNLQNVPGEARRMFIAPEGKYIIGADYSQIEPRTLAHFTQDPAFMDPYITGKDLYVQIASDVYDIPYENALEEDDMYWRNHTSLPKHPRKLAKVILLAVTYGISPYSLSTTLQTTPEEAEKFIDDFYKTYPIVREWMDKIIEQADTQGFVTTMFGRKRRFPGHQQIATQYHAIVETAERANGGELPNNVWEAEIPYKLKQRYWDVAKDYGCVERQSVNAVIQGSASDILKRAMVAVFDHIKAEHPDWKLLATIHDEILIEVPNTVTPEEIEEVERILIETTKLDVPIKVDTEVMVRWGEGVPKKVWVDNGCKLEEEQ